MNHLIVCREYPPAPGGGIGTYTAKIAQLLASRGEIVHVVGQQWHGAQRTVERLLNGCLTIHRLPYDNWAAILGRPAHPALRAQPERGLFNSSYPPQCFAWQVAVLAERLVEREGIDLIEAPEYEAPLYFFMLRRALGFGPRRQPPCLIHLHSPTEFIARHNDWPLTAADISTALQLEAYTMAAADGLLCPSDALAVEAVEHYGLVRSDIAVIPLPLGRDSGVLKRDASTWASGSICFVGRLERRKGVLEYLDAAVAVAQENPAATFEFVGANVLASDPVSSAALVEQFVPRPLRRRFRFHGELPRAALPDVLRRARIAAVPSRWENFPYACVEALCSGLPALVTRRGAMPTMIEDGRSGWLVDDANPQCLVQALRRAVETPPAQLEAMGAEAAMAIRQLCDNDAILDRQLGLREVLVSRGAARSQHLPNVLPFAHWSRLGRPTRRQPRAHAARGIAVVLVDESRDAVTAPCVQAIAGQTEQPPAVVLATARVGIRVLTHWRVIRPPSDTQSTGTVAVQAALDESPVPLGIAVLGAGDELEPDFVACCAHVLTSCPEVGLVGGWVMAKGRAGRLEAHPCPAFPHQWLHNSVGLPVVVRAEALREAGGFPPGPLQMAAWEVANAVLAAGWIGVTYPAIWARHTAPRPAAGPGLGGPRQSLPARSRERFAELIRVDDEAIARLSKRPAGTVLHPGTDSWPKQLALVWDYAQHPRPLFRLFLWLARRLARSAVWAPPMWLSSVLARPTDAGHVPGGGHG